MKSRTAKIVCVVASTVLSLAALIAWPLSHSWNLVVLVPTPSGSRNWVCFSSCNGRLAFVLQHNDVVGKRTFEFQLLDTRYLSPERQWVRKTDDSLDAAYHLLGFGIGEVYCYPPPPGMQMPWRWTMVVPHWFLAVVAAILPLRSLIRAQRRRQRRRAGHCVECGYDLRASPQRCPECGSVPDAKHGASISSD